MRKILGCTDNAEAAAEKERVAPSSSLTYYGRGDGQMGFATTDLTLESDGSHPRVVVLGRPRWKRGVEKLPDY